MAGQTNDSDLDRQHWTEAGGFVRPERLGVEKTSESGEDLT